VHVPHASRIDLLAAVGEVRVLAVLLRAAAGEVLAHRGDGLRPQLLALQPADVGEGEPFGDLDVLAVGAPGAGPARVGGQVDLRVQAEGDADGAVLAAHGVREALGEFRVVEGAEAERLGPLREGPRGQAGAEVVAERMPGVGGDGRGDGERLLLDLALHRVRPFGHLARAVGLECVDVVDAAVEDRARGRVADRAGGVEVREPHQGLEHQARLVLEGHPAEQVLRAASRVEAGVLVRVQRAVVHGVTPSQSFVRERGRRRCVRVRDRVQGWTPSS
jgi:hypothetical protein